VFTLAQTSIHRPLLSVQNSLKLCRIISRLSNSIVHDTVSGLSDNSKSVGCWYFPRFFRSHSLSLVKPDATPEEVSAVVQSDQGAGGQVFAQAVRAASFHLSYFLNEFCSLRLLRGMESLAPHIGKSRNDMKTSERSNVRSPSWHKCSMTYDLDPDLPKPWTYCLHRWMSLSINRRTLSTQSRHPQLRFRKIQKPGMLHVGSRVFI
jgi:hypothetical protein